LAGRAAAGRAAAGRPDEDHQGPLQPYPTGKTKANDPTIWGTRAQAAELEKRIVNGQSRGVDIQLGDLSDRTWLIGIDLHTCLGPSGFEPWAAEIIDRFDSYGEVSPSGTGAKLFLQCLSTDIPTIRAKMGGNPHGKMFKRPGGGDHPPAIELHISNRYSR
jgi:hypothetical protein